MTGYDIYKNAIIRLGYPNGNNSENEKRLFKSAPEFISLICNNLNLFAPKDLSEEFTLTEQQAEAVCCGLCMLISRSEGDKNKCDLYTAVYNNARAKVLFNSSVIKDTLPSTVDGGR
jgi:hypothetical protein